MRRIEGRAAAPALIILTLALSGCMQATSPNAGYSAFQYPSSASLAGTYSGTSSESFYYPRGIAVDDSGDLYVVDSYNDRIVEITGGIESADSPAWANVWPYSTTYSQYSLKNPEGIAIDSTGTNIWIADSANKRIVHLSSGITSTTADYFTTAVATNVTTSASATYTFDYPTGVALVGTTLYVTDPGSDYPYSTPRIFKVDTSATSSTTYTFKNTESDNLMLAGRGSGDYEFSYPRGIAVDSTGTYVYVADETNYRIVRLGPDLNNGWKTLGGTRGSGTGQFKSPQTIAVDSSGDIYVVDSGNCWIVRMTDIYGTNWTRYGSQTGYSSTSIYPNWVAVNSSGHIFVTDDYFNRIAEFQ